MKTIEEVTLLYEITKALNEHLDLKKSLYKVLDILSSSMNMVRGTITILNPVRNEINIEVAHGLTRMPNITLTHPETQTNIVIFELYSKVSGSDFQERLNNYGVKVTYLGSQRFRAVTHRMVNTADIDEALTRIETGLKKIA